MAKKKYTLNSRGRYETKVWDGTYTASGAKHRITVSSTKSSRDLEKKVQELKDKVNGGHHVIKENITFSDYAKKWKDTKKFTKSDNTKAMYDNIVNKHFAAIRTVPLSEIRNFHFNMVINAAADKPRTCQQIYMCFKQIIKNASVDGYIAKGIVDDIFYDINLPKYISPEKRPLHKAEVDAIKSCSTLTSREKAFLYIAYGTGMRKGEILALKKSDIFLKAPEPYIHVQNTVIFIKNKPKLKNIPKSGNGIRDIPLTDFLYAFLRDYLKSCKDLYLIAKTDGSMTTKSSYDKMWISIQRKINKEMGGTDSVILNKGMTAHILRHNYCTNLCYQIPTVSIGRIAQLLGDSERMVIDVYNHICLEKEDSKKAIEQAVGF